jgi:hypothetical protein
MKILKKTIRLDGGPAGRRKPAIPASERGVALVMVVLILAGLMLIAAPFLLSMRMDEQTAQAYPRKTKARYAAEGALNHAVAALWETHEDSERLALDNRASGFATPDYDGRDEIDVNFDEVRRRADYNLADSAGVIWEARADDENGKVNINSAPPLLISNLLGATVLLDNIAYNDTEIPVEDTTPFFADADPDTIDGFILIDREYIAYCGKTAESFTGCMRGLFMDPTEHGKGALVQDGRGWKVSEHRAYANRGRFTAFETPDSIRDVASWTRFSFLVDVLRFHRLYMDQLKDYGVSERMVEDAGINAEELAAPEYEKPAQTADEKAAASKLRQAGFDPEVVSKLAGGRSLIGLADAVTKMPKNQLDAIKAHYNKFAADFAENKKRMEEFLPTAFSNIKKILRQMDMLMSVETLDARQFELIREYITTSSWRPADWTLRTPLLADIPRISQQKDENYRTLVVNAANWYNPGTTVRLECSSVVEYAVIEGHVRGGLLLSADVNCFDNTDTFVQAQYRHPININTAPLPVLRAVFTGVRSMGGMQRRSASGQIIIEFVTPAEAAALADMVRARTDPIAGLQDFVTVLDEAVSSEVISDADRLALIINAINPNDPSLAAGTVPFIYSSKNVYSITATGLVNSPAGEETASYRIRRVLEVAPPRPLLLIRDGQEDFSAGITWGGTPDAPRVLMFEGRLSNKYITQPNPTRPSSGNAASFLFLSQCHDNTTDNIRIDTLRAATPTGTIYSNHWDDTLDGTDQSTIQQATTSLFPVQGGGGAPGGGAAAAGTDMAPGTFQIWFKPNTQGARFFFDAGESEWVNRIAFYYDGSALVLHVADATLEQRAAIVRAPLQTPIEKDVWYHVAASWRGVRYGDLSVFIDGKPAGKYTEAGHLAQYIDAKAYQIPLDDASFLPGTGVALIDNEMVEYVRTGNWLVIPSVLDPPGPNDPPLPPGMVPPSKRVATRGSTPSAHSAGTVVTIFGYSNPLAEKLPVGGAQLAQRLYDHTPRCKVLILDNRTSIPATDTVIPVDNCTEFEQTGGICWANSEIFAYASIIPQGNHSALAGCTRGIEGTTAADLANNTEIFSIGILVSDTTDYKNQGYIQINDEWIYYSTATEPRFKRNYFLVSKQVASRGTCGTAAAAHAPGADVIPVFTVANRWCGAGDLVTVTDDSGGTPAKEQITIHHTYMDYVAFDRFTRRPYIDSSNRARGRLLKWPSGELPSAVPPTTTVGGTSVAGVPDRPLDGRIDELVTGRDTQSSWASQYYLIIQRDTALGKSDTSIYVNNEPTGPRGGLIIPPNAVGRAVQASILKGVFNGPNGPAPVLLKIDDEYIGAYSTEWSGDCTGILLTRCVRGMLGTTAADHPDGSRITVIPWPKVGVFSGAASGTGFGIQITNWQQDVPREGYLQVQMPQGRGEIVPYRQTTLGWFERHVDVNNNPCFRSAFGSPRTNWADGDFAVFLPVRYWDLYAPRVDSVQGVIFQTTETCRDAYWRTIHWTETETTGKDVIFLMRFDGSPDWTDAPTNKPGGLYMFGDPDDENRIGVQADKVEIRVFMTYNSGAYLTDVWKTTPTLERYDIEYTQPPVVHETEILER